MISHPLRCLYVHVPKTAGTSLKRLLADYDLAGRREPAGVRRLYSHASAARLRAELAAEMGAAEAASYFQYSFVRNPWDRLVSCFFYLDAGGSGRVQELPRVAAIRRYRGDFRRFVLEGLARLKDEVEPLAPQHLWTHQGLDPAAPLDFIGRYENLAADYAQVARRLGLTPSPLPHLRAAPRRPYPEYYDDQTRALTAEIYARDIELFDYRFGD